MNLAPLVFLLAAVIVASAQDPAPAHDKTIEELIRALDAESPALRDAAEAELFRLMASAEGAMRAAIGGASPEARLRLERILEWAGPEWGAAAERVARAAWGGEEDLRAQKSVVAIPMKARALDRLGACGRLFRVTVPDPTAAGSHPEVRVVWRDGTLGAWDEAARSRLFVSAGLQPDNSGRAAAAALYWLVQTWGRGSGDAAALEDRRIEVDGNKVVYRHRVLDFYEFGPSWTGDRVLEFGEGTLEVTSESEEFDNQLTEEEIAKILERPDPWLEIRSTPPPAWQERVARFERASRELRDAR